MRSQIIRHVGMNEGRTILQRLFEVYLHRQGFEVDFDQRRRILCGVAVDGDHHGDGLPDIMDIATRQRPLRLRIAHRWMGDEQRHRHVEWADVVAGIDRSHPRIIASRGYVDFFDTSARHVAAQKRRVQRVGQRNVVDIGALAAQQLRIDIAFDTGAECSSRHELVPSLAAEQFGSTPNGRDDVDVSGAAAEVARQYVANAAFRKVERLRLVEATQNVHDHSWRAEATLQGVAFLKRLLDRVQRTVGGRDVLYGADAAPIGLYCKSEARTAGLAVDVDGAAATHAVLTADMGSSQSKFVPQEIAEQHADADRAPDLLTVYSQCDFDARVAGAFRNRRFDFGAGHQRHGFSARDAARATKRRMRPPSTRRRNEAVVFMSSATVTAPTEASTASSRSMAASPVPLRSFSAAVNRNGRSAIPQAASRTLAARPSPSNCSTQPTPTRAKSP